MGILIDGYYVYDEKSKSNVYEKRSDEELEKLGALVKSAIGYDQNRGDTIEIVNLKFIDNNFEKDIQKANWLDDNLKNLIQMGMIGVIVILVILLIFRPILAKILEANKSGFGEINKFFDFKKFGTNNKYSGEDNMDNKDFSSSALNDYSESGGKKIPVGMKHKQILDKINELVENYPEEATEILKKWINNDQKIL